MAELLVQEMVLFPLVTGGDRLAMLSTRQDFFYAFFRKDSRMASFSSLSAAEINCFGSTL